MRSMAQISTRFLPVPAVQARGAAASSFSIARSLAHVARLFSFASSGVHERGLRVSTLAVGCLPQVQMGALGGQVQGCS